MSSNRERLGAIATFLQGEDDELLYFPDVPSSSERGHLECPFPHPVALPIVGEVGRTTCPCCGVAGVPLGCDSWYEETDPRLGHLYVRSYVHEVPCACTWTHLYRVVAGDFGRVLQYVETESFGCHYPWTTERQAVPDVLKELCRE